MKKSLPPVSIRSRNVRRLMVGSALVLGCGLSAGGYFWLRNSSRVSNPSLFRNNPAVTSIEPVSKTIEEALWAHMDPVMTTLTSDPNLEGLIAELWSKPNPKIFFHAFENLSKFLSDEMGIPGENVDGYTIAGVVKGPHGQIKREIYQILLENPGPKNLGELCVIVQHELYHILRIRQGQVLSTRSLEEVATFTLSIAASERLAQDARDLARDTSLPMSTRQKLIRMAEDIDRALVRDRGYLDFWRSQ